jgi:hypothetical protein
MKIQLPTIKELKVASADDLAAVKKATEQHLTILANKQQVEAEKTAKGLAQAQENSQRLSQEIVFLTQKIENLKAPTPTPTPNPEPEPNPAPTPNPVPVNALPYTGSGFNATGGQGGKVIEVSTGEALLDALEEKAPRIIKITVPVIDLQPYVFQLVTHGNFTLQGMPGGSTIWGLEISIKADNVIFDNLRMYVGDALPHDELMMQASGWSAYSERDNLKINGNFFLAKNCIFGLATDELVQTTGSNIAFFRTLFLEPLASLKHHKGAHPYGSIHFCYGPNEGKNLAFIECGWLNCLDRTPQLTAGTTSYMRNCFIGRARFGINVVNDNIRLKKRGPHDTGGLTLIAENVVMNRVNIAARLVMRPVETRSKLYFSNFIVNGINHTKPWESLNELQGEGHFGKHTWQNNWHQLKDATALPAIVAVANDYATHNIALEFIEAYVFGHAGPIDAAGQMAPDKITRLAIHRAKAQGNAEHFDTIRGALTEDERKTFLNYNFDLNDIFKNKLVDGLAKFEV